MYVPNIPKSNIKSTLDFIQEINVLGVETIELEDGNYLFNVKYTNTNFICKEKDQQFIILTKNPALNEYVVMYKGKSAQDIIYALEDADITKVVKFSELKTCTYEISDIHNAILSKVFQMASGGNIQYQPTEEHSEIVFYVGVDTKITFYKNMTMEINSVQLGTYLIDDINKHQLQTIYEKLRNYQ